MKIETYKFPHSSFLAMEKDMSIIIDYILKNERLKKLLFYTTADCLDNVVRRTIFRIVWKEY